MCTAQFSIRKMKGADRASVVAGRGVQFACVASVTLVDAGSFVCRAKVKTLWGLFHRVYRQRCGRCGIFEGLTYNAGPIACDEAAATATLSWVGVFE